MREAKAAASSQGMSLSEFVEDMLVYVTATRWLMDLSRRLGLELSGKYDPDMAVKGRPRGYDAAAVVRELREGRAGGP